MASYHNISHKTHNTTEVSTIQDVLNIFNVAKVGHNTFNIPSEMSEIVDHLDRTMHREGSLYGNYHIYSMRPTSKYLYAKISLSLLQEGIEFMRTSIMSSGLHLFLDYLFSKRRVDKQTKLYKVVEYVEIPAAVSLFFRSAATERCYYVGFVLKIDRIYKMYVYNNIPDEAKRKPVPIIS